MNIIDLRNNKKEKSIEKENYLTEIDVLQYINSPKNNIINLRNLKNLKEKENIEKDYSASSNLKDNVVNSISQKKEEILEWEEEEKKEEQVVNSLQCINPVDIERRKLLKFLLIGAGTFILGALTRFLGIGSTPQLLKNYANSESEKSLFDKENNKANLENQEINEKENLENEKLLVNKENKEADFGNWKINKKNNELIFTDKKANEEVLILDWGNKNR